MIHKSVLLTSLSGAIQLCYMAQKEKNHEKQQQWLKDLDNELSFIYYCTNKTTKQMKKELMK